MSELSPLTTLQDRARVAFLGTLGVAAVYFFGGLAVGEIRTAIHRPDSVRAAVAADGFSGYNAGSSFDGLSGSHDTARFGDCLITIAGLDVEPTSYAPKRDLNLSDFSPASLMAIHEVGGVSNYDIVVPGKPASIVRVQNASELREYAAANAIPKWQPCFAEGSSTQAQ